MVRTTIVGILAFVFVWGLTACGGGGGGGSENESNPPLPENAEIELDPDDYASRQTAINTKEDSTAILNVYGDAERTYLLGEDVDSAVSSLPSPSISGNKLTYECENNGNVVITVNSDDTSDDEAWLFTNCQLTTENFGEIVLNGDYYYKNKVVNGDSEGGQYFNITGENSDSKSIVIKGLDEWKVSEDREEYTTAALEFKVGDEYFAIADAKTLLVIRETEIELTLNARLIGSMIDGYADISTPTPVLIAAEENCPGSGVVRMDGANETFAEIFYGTSSGTSSTAVVVTNGSESEPYDDCDSLILGR